MPRRAAGDLAASIDSAAFTSTSDTTTNTTKRTNSNNKRKRQRTATTPSAETPRSRTRGATHSAPSPRAKRPVLQQRERNDALAVDENSRKRIHDVPQTLLSEIFLLAAAELSYLTSDNASLTSTMPELVQVCRRWRKLAHKIESERARATELLTFATDEPEALAAMYKRLELSERGKQLRCLRVSMGATERTLYEPRFRLHVGLGSCEQLDALAIDWDRIFRACPELLRLDCSQMPLDTPHVRAIVTAASVHCAHLQALELPQHEVVRDKHALDDGRDVLVTMDVLYKALERWRTRGARKGLLQLSVPKRHGKDDEDKEERANEWLRALAACCPSVEYIDGWKASYDDRISVDCDDYVRPSLDVWTAFCRTASRLRELNWAWLPLEDAYLLAFGRHPKPLLRKLMLTGGVRDETGDTYLDESELFDRTLRFEMDSVLAVIRACPALEELQFMFDGWGNTPSQCLQEQLTDGVLRSIAAACPRLKRLFVDEVPGKYAECAIDGVTDAGLHALATLPDLAHIALKQTLCSAKGVLSLVLDAPKPQQCRRVAIRVGSRIGAVSYFDALLQYMEHMLALPPASLAGRVFELELVNEYAQYDADYVQVKATFAALRARLRRRHRDLRVLFRDQDVVESRTPTDIMHVQSVIFASPKTAPIKMFSRLFETSWTSKRSPFLF